jgi:hypothetical protein
MGYAKDVDDYIANAPECTRPILVKLRRIIQQASPKLQELLTPLRDPAHPPLL